MSSTSSITTACNALTFKGSSTSVDLNPIATLLHSLSQKYHPGDDAKAVKKGVETLSSVFRKLRDEGRIDAWELVGEEFEGKGGKKEGSSSKAKRKRDETEDREQEQDPDEIVKRWLGERYKEFIDLLGGLLWHENGDIRLLSLHRLLSLLQPSPSHPNQVPIQPATSSLFKRVVRLLILPDVDVSSSSSESLLSSKDSKKQSKNKEKSSQKGKGSLERGREDDQPLPFDVVHEFSEKWLEVYDDIRWGFLKEATSLCNHFSSTATYPPKIFSISLVSLLTRITTMPTEAEEVNSWWMGDPKPIVRGPGTGGRSNAAEPTKKRRKRGMRGNSDAPSGNPEDEATGIFDSTSSEDDDEHAGEELSNLKSNDGNVVRNKKPNPITSLTSHQVAFTNCWMSILGIGLGEIEVKMVLDVLHRQVLPHLSKDKVIGLMDFLVDCVDSGGVIALLALNSLFTLIHKYNLDYPDFYRKVYGLLDRKMMHVRFRTRFLRLLETFLSSTHLPVTLVASFIKRLSRLALNAPPPAIVAIIPFVYNLLKAHPACMVMVHKSEDDNKQEDDQTQWTGKPEIGDDLDDPYSSYALNSSLWELAALQKHFYPSVASLAKLFGQKFNKPRYEMDDFFDHTYTSMLESDLHRKIKKTPPLSLHLSLITSGDSREDDEIDSKVYFPPQGYFDNNNKEGGESLSEEDEIRRERGRDVVSELWCF